MKKVMVYFINIIGKGMTGQKELLAVLVVFVLADYLTESMVAVVKKKITHGLGIEGILRRCAIFIIILLAGLLDVYVIRNGDTITVGIILFYLSFEGLAVVKNLIKLGLPFPKAFKNTLEKMKSDST